MIPCREDKIYVTIELIHRYLPVSHIVIMILELSFPSQQWVRLIDIDLNVMKVGEQREYSSGGGSQKRSGNGGV